MIIRRHAAVLALGAILALAPAALAASAEGELTVEKMNVTDQTSPPPFAPHRITVSWTDSGPDVPGNLTDIHHGTASVAGSDVALAMGKTADSTAGPDVVYVDGNHDGKFTEPEKYAMDAKSQPMRTGGNALMGNNLDVVIKAGAESLPFVFAYSIVGDEVNGQLIAIYYGSAKVSAGGTDYTVSILDGDADGKFGGAKDLWTMRPATDPVTRPESEGGMTGGQEKRFLDAKLFTLAVAKDKVTLAWEAAEGPDPASMAAQRDRVEESWTERFAPTKEEFEKQRGMDTTRPLAKTPIHWNYVTFEKAQQMAREQGKPLFVDVMAFWCVWCYRMDFHTYPDQAVADLLNDRFVPVKIIQEQDRAGDYQKLMTELGARGIPAMGVWSPNGKLVKYISGWSTPEAFEATLREALDAAETAPTPAAGDK